MPAGGAGWGLAGGPWGAQPLLAGLRSRAQPYYVYPVDRPSKGLAKSAVIRTMGPAVKICRVYPARASHQVNRKGDKAGTTRSSKSGANDVLSEALRAGHMLHVDAPQPPTLLLGDRDELLALADEIEFMAAQVEVTYTHKSGREMSRKQRSDEPVLATTVYSHPKPVADCGPEPAKDPDIAKWIELNIEDAKRQYGPALRGIVLHLDESHPHMHVLACRNGRSVRDLHPGFKAQQEGGHYRTAMRAMLDTYNREVGQFCGLTRTGPRKRGLSRAAWLAEKDQAEALARVLSNAEAIKQQLRTEVMDQARADIEQQKAAALEGVKAKQAEVEQAREDVRGELRKVRAEGRSVQSNAETVAAAVTRLKAERAQFDQEAKKLAEERKALEADMKRFVEEAKRPMHAHIAENKQLRKDLEEANAKLATAADEKSRDKAWIKTLEQSLDRTAAENQELKALVPKKLER